MKIGINLASQAFRNDRPILIASGALSLVMVGTLAMLIWLAWSERVQLKDARESVVKLEQKVRTLTAEQARLDAVLRQPGNSEVLERSLFLNSLLFRKGISWTRIFSDLEKTVPYNVRVISIRPQVNAQNRIALEMMVGAESAEPLGDLIMRLESSDVFGATFVHTTLVPTQSEPLYRYRVSTNYGQNF